MGTRKLLTIVIALGLVISGCASKSTISAAAGKVNLHDGVSKSEAIVLAKNKLMTPDGYNMMPFVRMHTLFFPRVKENLDGEYSYFWFVYFRGLLGVNDFLVVVDKRSGFVLDGFVYDKEDALLVEWMHKDLIPKYLNKHYPEWSHEVL